jgi:hypothetical protein
MADDLSLLFRLRGDSSGAVKATADARAAVNQLRQSFGPQLTESVNVANKAFSGLSNSLESFVTQRVPLVGGVLVRISEGLKTLGSQSPKTQKAVASVADSIQSIATQSGKTAPQIASFLSKYIQLEGQSKRNEAAFKFFGGSVDQLGNKTAKFIPELEQVGSTLAGVAGQSVAAGSSIAAMAGPIGIAVLALAALAAGAVLAAKELFELSKRTAEFQGRMFDLAQQTGLAVETLSAFEVVARTTGGSLDTISQAVVLFQRKLDDAQDPLSKTAEQFRKFNVETNDTENALRQTFAALAAMPEGFAQTNAAAEFFGARGGKQVLAILKETNGDLDGTIKRLREAGVLISDDAARAADKFNDELALLDFQLRALGAAAVEEVIPALTEMIRSLGEIVTAARPLISLFGTIAGPTARATAAGFKGLSIVVQALTRDYEGLARSIKEAREAQEIAPLTIPDLRPTPLPGVPTGQQTASEAVNQADAVLAAVKRKAAEQNQALAEMFQQGRRTREQEALSTIVSNRQVLKADQDRVDALLAQKEQEIKALDEAQRNRGEIVNRDSEQYRAITSQITKLQQERLDKESEFEITSRAIRAKAAKEKADSKRNELANERDLLLGEFDRTIKDVEAQVARGAKAEEDGLVIIEQLERAKIDARLESLQKQRDIGFLSVEDQREIDQQLQALQQERDRLDDEQQQRRLQRERNAAARTRDILTANLDTLLELEQIVGDRRIATIQALADQRVITEEEAARRILQIRLDLLDDEIETTQGKLEASKSIADKDERIRAQAELNNQLKILKEQRVTIETEGNRGVDDAHRQDIENERRYADELEDIRERIRDIERDTAEEVIRLMRLHFASRKDIIRARLQLDIADENSRHEQALETIRALEQENAESNRTQSEKDAQTAELHRLREAEAERHRLAMQGIQNQGKRDEDEADPIGRIGLGVEDLENFARVIEDTIVPLNEILRGSFEQVADAIGQTVSNWVLLGETGPAVMRKILAQALASLAAEAAVNAIKELALGFATLFFNPAESAAHFTAAGLWGSIAGVAAIAGRGVAGDLFKSKSTGSGSGVGTSERGSGQLDPITLSRNQPQPPNERKIVVEFKVDSSQFGKAITAHVVRDYRQGGDIRQVIVEDGGPNG